MTECSVAGEKLVLLPERVAYWPAKKALFVADFHLGKAASFRSAGIPLPSGTTLVVTSWRNHHRNLNLPVSDSPYLTQENDPSYRTKTQFSTSTFTSDTDIIFCDTIQFVIILIGDVIIHILVENTDLLEWRDRKSVV